MGERPGAAAPRRRRTARRLQPLQAPPRGRPLARAARRPRPAPADPVAGAPPPAPAHRRLPLLLRAHARPAVGAVPDPARAPQEVGDALPGLGHPRQDAGGARVRAQGRSRDRRLRTTRSAGCRMPSSSRRAWTSPRSTPEPPSRPRTPGDPPRALLAPPEGNRARRSPRARGSTPTSSSSRARPPRGVRALPRGRHRGRPAERRLVRPVRDRVHGARQAGGHVPARRGGAPHRAGARRRRCRSSTRRRTTCARGSSRSSPTPPSAAGIGEASRAYAERVHDLDAVADRLLALYSRL